MPAPGIEPLFSGSGIPVSIPEHLAQDKNTVRGRTNTVQGRKNTVQGRTNTIRRTKNTVHRNEGQKHLSQGKKHCSRFSGCTGDQVCVHGVLAPLRAHVPPLAKPVPSVCLFHFYAGAHVCKISGKRLHHHQCTLAQTNKPVTRSNN